jgi:hypothetical protein
MSSRTGKKAMRDNPLFYDELKARHGIWLTPKAWENLQTEAKRQNLSVSELIEQYARKLHHDEQL